MKKYLAIILSTLLLASLMQGYELLFMPASPASANMTPDGQPYPPAAPPAAVPKQNISFDASKTQDLPDEPATFAGGSSGTSTGVIVEAPPTAPCQTYNGSSVYTPDVGKTCQGNIVKPNGDVYSFSCAPNGNRSAIYISYKMKEYHEIATIKVTSNGTYPPSNNGWKKYTIGGTYYFSNPGGSWKILDAKGYAESTQFIDGQLWGWEWSWTVGSITKTTNQKVLNSLYQVKYNWKGYQTFTAESAAAEYVIEDIQCQYPYEVKEQDLYSVTCFVSYDTFFYKSETKQGIVPPGGQFIEEHRNLPAGNVAKISAGKANNWGVNIGNHLLCNNDSLSGYDEYNLAAPEQGGYGYYRITADAYAVKCFVSGYPTWTFNKSKDKIKYCTDIFKYNSYYSYAVYSCSGFNQTGQGSAAWAALPNNVNFAVSACETFGCTVSGTLQIGETGNPIQVMRNGENIKVTYPSVTVQASGNSRPDNGATNWESVIEAASGVKEGSSPFYGTSTNSSKQYFSLLNAEDKAITFLNARNASAVSSTNSNPSSAWQPMLSNGAPNPNFSSGYTRFTWASNTGKSWNMFRAFRVKGEFFVPVADSGTNGGTSMGWQSEVKYCGDVSAGQLSNPVTVVRSVNEVQ